MNFDNVESNFSHEDRQAARDLAAEIGAARREISANRAQPTQQKTSPAGQAAAPEAVEDSAEFASTANDENDTSGEEVHDDGQTTHETYEEPATDPFKSAEYQRYLQETAARVAAAEQAKRDYEARLAHISNLAQSFSDPIVAEWNKLGPDGQVKLAQDNPADYLAKRAHVDTRLQQMAMVQQEQARIRNEQIQKLSQQSHAELLKRYPAWKDSSVQSKAATDIIEFLRKNNFTQQEIDSVVDHRMVDVIYKAAQYEKSLQAKKSLPDKKVVKTTKTLTPGAARNPKADQESKELKDLGTVMKKSRNSRQQAEALGAFVRRLNQKQ
jgi:hypothetical protein